MHPSHSILRETMQRLWLDHVYWTRLFIVSTVAGMNKASRADLDPLAKNQNAIGEMFSPVYGTDVGERVSALLWEHILGAASVLRAAISGDQAAFQSAMTAWRANADQISAALASLNPDAWPYETVRRELYHHLDLTAHEADQQIQGDFAGSVQTFGAIERYALTLADMMSNGLIRHRNIGSNVQRFARLPMR